MSLETNNFIEELLELRIESDSIPSALSNEVYQLLHKKLKLFSPFWIRENWQLQALLGDEATYNDLHKKDHNGVNMAHYAALSGHVKRLHAVYERNPALFEQKDNYGQSAWHYAVYSDNPEALNWMKQYCPNLSDSADSLGQTLGHHAALAGNLDVLNLIKQHCPDQLTAADQWGSTLAHYAAESGNFDVLNWINQHCPRLLDSVDKWGRTLAHYGVRSLSQEVLKWIARNCPQLLTLNDRDGQSIVRDAALCGNADMFNLALALSDNRHEVNFAGLGITQFKLLAMPTLNKALKTNTTLTDIRGIDPSAWAELKPMLDANKLRIQNELKEIINKFTLLIYERNSQGDRCLPKDILLTLFMQAVESVTDRMSKQDIAAQFKKIVDNTENYKIKRVLQQRQGFVLFFNMQAGQVDGAAMQESQVYSPQI